jgi:hypothetical protein
MDSVIRGVYSYDLSGVDVETITRGKAVVRLYKDLMKFDNIISALGRNGQMILLFPVASDSSGHWISVLYHPETHTIEHCDSYGLSWVQELGYTDNKYAKRNLLGELYDKAKAEGYKVEYSPYKLQKMKKGYNDCGRHASIRCRFHYLNIDEYAKLMMGQTMSPDWLVSALTFLTLREASKDEEEIVRELGKGKGKKKLA